MPLPLDMNRYLVIIEEKASLVRGGTKEKNELLIWDGAGDHRMRNNKGEMKLMPYRLILAMT